MGENMRIVYAATTCSDRVYQRLYANTDAKPMFQAQKYHRLLIEGLAAHVPVDVIANPPVNRSVLTKPFERLERETEGGAQYRYVSAVRNPVLKMVWVSVSMFTKTLIAAGRDSAVVIDCLNRTAALSALLAARLRGRPCVGIITDLPDMLGGGRLYLGMANWIVRHCTHYVLLTEAMNDYIRNPGKPYVVLEGHADITMKKQIPSMDMKLPKRVCLYAGILSRQYGLETLVQGFRKAAVPDTQLHLYGIGDYVPELQQIAQQDPDVVYGGMLLSSQVVQKEREATLLVNPRPTNEEYVKYSFPSKTMEYMSTGTPVLTTILPGLPKEYYPHVFLIPDETPEGIADALRKVFENSDAQLFEKGLDARRFVLEERNNVVQAGKILKMLGAEE